MKSENVQRFRVLRLPRYHMLVDGTNDLKLSVNLNMRKSGLTGW